MTLTQLQRLLVAELHAYCLGELDADIAELQEMREHLAKLVEEKGQTATNEVKVVYE